MNEFTPFDTNTDVKPEGNRSATVTQNVPAPQTAHYNTVNITNQKPSRSRFHAQLSDPNSSAWKELAAQGKETNLPFETLLRKHCGGPENGMPSNILYDFMAREDIYPADSKVKCSPTMQESLSTPLKANCTYSHWSNLFLDAVFNSSSEKHLAITSDTGVPGSVFRPFGDLPGLRDANPFVAEISLNQVIGRTITQADDDVRDTSYTEDESIGDLIAVAQSGDFPEIEFTTAQQANTMWKNGFAIKFSKETREKPIYNQAIEDIIVKQGVRLGHAMTNYVLKQIWDAHDATYNPIVSNANTTAGFVKLTTSAKNGFAIDTIVAQKGTYETLVTALLASSVGSSQPLPVGAETRVPGLLGPVSSMNTLGRPTQIGWVSGDSATAIGGTGFSTAHKLCFDQGQTADLHLKANGMVEEEEYTVRNQEWILVRSIRWLSRIRDRHGIWLFN